MLSKTKRQVITTSIDGFHHPKEVRYRQGRTSAQGYYDDSFNYSSLAKNLLEPLSKNGSRVYVKKIFDVRTNTPINETPQLSTPDSILILEGIFLFGPEILHFLDYKIWIDIPFSIASERMLKRDAGVFKTEEEQRKLFNQRYTPGQQLYFDKVRPSEIADVVIDNTAFEHTKITKPSK